MSARTKYILAIIALLTVFLIIEYRMPRKFVWEPTFAHNDPQPFGCLVFDSVLAASMPQGYAVTRNTLWQMEQDSVFTEPKAVVIITKEDIDAQIKKVLDLAHQGHTMVVATIDLYNWCDTLGIDYNFNKTFKLNDIAGKQPDKGTLHLVDDASERCSADSATIAISVYEQMVERTLDIPDSVDCEVLATFLKDQDLLETLENIGNLGNLEKLDSLEKASVVAAAFPLGKGELILVSSPLLLTNYGMVSGDGHRFIAHLMNRVKHLPVIRTEGYMSATAHQEQSPLYVLLQRPPMRWAVYLTMLTLLLFCIFTARRRQRVIPIITKPRNANLEFVRLIGTLYWQRHNNADLLAKKLAFTADELRRQLNIDITAIVAHASQRESVVGDASQRRSEVDTTLGSLAHYTGRTPEELRLLLKNIRQAASGNYTVSDAELKTFIDQLDSLIARD